MSAFANAANKLGAPPKKSVFERQKEEAEAKKTREKAETAAAYEDFVKSFEGDADAPPQISRPTQGSLGGGHGPGKRHFTSSGLKSGPGSLGPAPGLAFGKKRQFDDFSGRRDRERDSHRDRDRMFGYEQIRDRQDKDMFVREEEDRKDDEDQAARPTLHLASLPPGTSPAVIKALLTSSPLVVENIRILPGSTADRKAFAAIVTLAAETPSSEIDTVVSQLQNKYLGSGFSLSISRHLSSAALIGTNAINTPGSTASMLPFGARPITQNISLSRAPPPGQSGRFAPPSSYTSSTPYSQRPQSQVVVSPPSDLKQLKLIHKTLEAILTYGPEFEALLMSRSQIQRDPQWSWLYTPRSQSGVYYRWRMWEIITSSNSRQRHGIASYGGKPQSDFLFENQPQWIPPPAPLKFEYTTHLDDFVSDEDYNSSDEEDNDEPSLAQRHNDHNDHNVPNTVDASTTDNDGTGYLNPLAKAKIVHLLSRLPDSNAKLRKGDVARITAFAIEHAGSGAAEVADLVTLNIVRPFSLRSNRSSQDRDSHSDSDVEGDATSITRPSTNNTHTDPSPSSLIALYILSDILSASSSSGVRHAWRYRSLFHASLTTHHVFEVLGRYERKLQWGKLKAEKWRRSVMMLLSVWEGWGVWMGDVLEGFRKGFDEGAKAETEGKNGTERGHAEEDAAVPGNAVGKTGFKTTAKWKSVDDISTTPNAHSVLADKDTIDGTTMSRDNDAKTPSSNSRLTSTSKHPSKSRSKSNPKPKPNPTLDGDAMTLDSDSDSGGDKDVDVNVNPTDLINDSLDGIPMLDSSDEEMIDAPPPPPRLSQPPPPSQSPPSAPAQKDMTAVEAEDDGGKQVSAIRVPTSMGRQRPTAVDMFADEDEE